MSALRAACMRTPLRAPLRSPSTASTQPRLSMSRPPYTQRAALVRSQQLRFQSSGGDHADTKKQPPPHPSLNMVLGALRQSMSLKPLLGAFRGQSLRKLFHQSPEELVLALALLAGASCVLVYVVYTYFNYFQSRQFTRFPPEIAKSLRRALYYSNYAPDPKLALKWYKIALEQCEQHGLDPFSDEVMGLKIQLAAWLEKLGSYQNSIEVLEALLRDCNRWVEKMEQAVTAGQVDRNGMLVGAAAAPTSKPDEGASETESEEVPETLFGKRTRVLGKMVGINVKLGELYADEHVMQGDAAGERLVWAVETVLKELQRRQTQGLREGEGEWMSPEEIGGALEALANHYESKSQHYLAAPLYLQAITMSPPKSCHTAVLMNNLAISLAQQPVDLPSDLTGPGRPTRAALLASARSWANQAHTTGSRVTGEDRTPECDEACAVALCNLGQIAAMMGDKDESRKRFKESIALSKQIGFEEGISQSQGGLKAASSAPAVTKA